MDEEHNYLDLQLEIGACPRAPLHQDPSALTKLLPRHSGTRLARASIGHPPINQVRLLELVTE